MEATTRAQTRKEGGADAHLWLQSRFSLRTVKEAQTWPAHEAWLKSVETFSWI